MNCILRRLKAVILYDDDEARDGVFWCLEPNGMFSVSSVYSSISGGVEVVVDDIWKYIWKLEVPTRYSFFLWLVKHDRIMCNENRLRMGFTANCDCQFYHGISENEEHVLRKCFMAEMVWKNILPRIVYRNLEHLDFKVGLRQNLIHNGFVGLPRGWKEKFAISVWWIW